MVRNYRSFTQSQSDHNQQDDVNMDQYFGSDSIFNKKERIGTGKQADPVNIPTFSMSDVLEKLFSIASILPMKKKMGYILLIIACIISVVMSVIRIQFGQFLGSAIILVLALLFMRKWKDVPYTPELNYYCANATVTMKALFKQFTFTDALLSHSKTLLYLSSSLLIFQQIFLQWFAPYFISNLLYSISFFTMLFASLLCFANRETLSIVFAYKLYCFILLLVLFIATVFFGSFSYFTAMTYLILYSLSSRMDNWEIKSVFPNKKEQQN